MRARTISLLALLCFLASPAAATPERVTLELKIDGTGVARGRQTALDVHADIESGWHINAHRPKQPYLIPTELKLTLPPGVVTDTIHYPPPERKSLKFAGGEELLLYEGKLGIATAILVPEDFPGTRVRIEAALRYQACNDTTCLPPTNAVAQIVVPIVAPEDDGSDAVGGGGVSEDPRADGSQVSNWLQQHGLIFTLFAMTFLGLGLNLTPCVYPLISVTVAYFGGQSRSRGSVALLAVTYVIGIALSFSALGVVAALSGGMFGAALQKPPVVLSIAAILTLLALSNFGLYQLRPPAALMQRVGGASSGVLGALFMGLTMGVVAAPCVGPIVLGLLVFVGSRQDPQLGFLLFFVLALGMGAPYVALAMTAGAVRRLPRSGEWLVWTERVFGCVLISLAAYFVAPLLGPPLRSLLLPIVVALSGLYVGFAERTGGSIRGFPFIKRGVGIAFAAFALWLAMPVQTERAIAWQPITALLHDSASANGEEPLLIDFAAEWCIPCREMDQTTYVHPKVVREAQRFQMVKADITEENDETTQVVERYQVRGVPTIILFSSDGEERKRLVGYVGPEEMLAAMEKVH
jgi:thiol:disulfide interchange protein DsbD